MDDLSLNEEMNLEIQVRLISKANDEPPHGKNLSVRLYDKDLFDEEFLGETTADEEGLAKFIITPEKFTGPMGLDKKPDFYFVVFNDKREVFKSRVMANLDLSDIHKFIMSEGKIIDLGTFLI